LSAAATRPLEPVAAPRSRRIVVVHLVHTVAYGGVETTILNWLRGLDPSRFEAHLVCFANPGGTEAPFRAAAARAGFEVLTVPWSRRKPIIRSARRLAAILREVGADVVHTHNTYAEIVGLLAAKWAGCRTVTSLYVWSDFGWKRNVLQVLDRFVLRFYDVIAAQCEATLLDTIARGLPAERSKVLISGFVADGAPLPAAERRRRRLKLGVGDRHVVLVNNARFYPEKAQAALLQAFKTVRERCPEALLWLLGTGPLEGQLRALAHDLDLEPFVRWFGFVDDPIAVLKLADVQVHPSRAEGVPLAICDGMAVGLPIVASAVGGIPEMIADGESGILVPGEREPAFQDAFVAALVRLVGNPAERARLGAAARRFLETEYSLPAAVRALEATYAGVVARCASASS
jgi:glycosyltransferase involved in cell wall biosynthesis